MTSPQARQAGIIGSPQNPVVLQASQVQQQQISANKLASAANNILQLQQQQQLMLANGTPVVNLIPNQSYITNNNYKVCNGDNNENINQQNSISGPFKIYSE